MLLGMKLSDYLSQNEIADTAFAERIGVSRQALWRYKSGERRPEWHILEAIARETSGDVTPNDFMPSAHAEPANGDASPQPSAPAAA